MQVALFRIWSSVNQADTPYVNWLNTNKNSQAHQVTF